MRPSASRAAAGRMDPALARLAACSLLRFAQVYPTYATHFDQPGQPKFFQPADLPPPYRRGYGTAKWDWTGSLDVPLNLVIAYALIRDDPALAEAGRLLGDADPARTIERDLFRASAEFVRRQPEEFSEVSLHAYRGLLAVGRLLDDPALVHEAPAPARPVRRARASTTTASGGRGTLTAHRRVVGQIDGWIDRLLAGPRRSRPRPCRCSTWPRRPRPRRDCSDAARGAEVQHGRLAGAAGLGSLARGRSCSAGRGWPGSAVGAGGRRRSTWNCAGSANSARPGTSGWPSGSRSAAGPSWATSTTCPARPDGWDRATASHNTVVVDGLNQREYAASWPGARRRAATSSSSPPTPTSRSPPSTTPGLSPIDGPRAVPPDGRWPARGRRPAMRSSVFEVQGGLQHDQLFHAPAGSPARWRLGAADRPGPESLLPPSIPYLARPRAEDGRWFVQAFGDFARPGRRPGSIAPPFGRPRTGPTAAASGSICWATAPSSPSRRGPTRPRAGPERDPGRAARPDPPPDLGGRRHRSHSSS